MLHIDCTHAACATHARAHGCMRCTLHVQRITCARLHPLQASGALEATPMSGKPALSAAAKDWWITLEANEDDVASYMLGVQLLAAPPEVRRRAAPATLCDMGCNR
eukprot:scaffold21776_cov43-Phaeocystis_antarctica.AAC.1